MFSKLFCKASSTNPVENWAIENSKRCQAEDIIVAAIVESLAKDFDNWVSNDLIEKAKSLRHGRPSLSPTLSNKKKEIAVRFGVKEWDIKQNYEKIFYIDWTTAETQVNNIPISRPNARLILAAWEKVSKQVQRTKEAAARAKKDMERNEAAWNLAEKLLGMKRNEFGALVPMEKQQ